MRLARPLLILLRSLAPTLIILGIGFWTGHWPGLIPIHRALGTLFVLTLWSIAGIALWHGRATRGSPKRAAGPTRPRTGTPRTSPPADP